MAGRWARSPLGLAFTEATSNEGGFSGLVCARISIGSASKIDGITVRQIGDVVPPQIYDVAAAEIVQYPPTAWPFDYTPECSIRSPQPFAPRGSPARTKTRS